ncbi:MAG TPA: class I SAM-dependent methyltransferase [Rhabdochlamydiaceae bacterium]|nr:class I SAM-dependent methyltransferase [Rhabdochlamydiaceae bacterium]
MKKIILSLFFCFLPCLTYAGGELDQAKVEALKNHVCRNLSTLHGWCSQEKAQNFIDLVLEVKPDVCVEIGTFGGSSVLPVASALKFLDHGIVYAIDPWDKIEALKYFDPYEDHRHMDWWGKIDFFGIYHSFLNMVSNHELGKYVKVLRMTSEKAADEVKEAIDILYIDGNHSEAIALLDVKLYLPKVRQGGYIWLNDSTWSCMQPAVELLQESCDAIRLIDNGNCILFKKR